MISERLRNRAEVKGAADIAAGRKAPEYGKESEIEWEAADVIDALVAVVDTFVSEYVELVNSGDAGFWEPEDEPKVKAARRALAMARRK